MTRFSETFCIAAAPIWRAHGDSDYVGRKVMKELAEAGEIVIEYNASRTAMLNPAGAEKLHRALGKRRRRVAA